MRTFITSFIYLCLTLGVQLTGLSQASGQISLRPVLEFGDGKKDALYQWQGIDVAENQDIFVSDQLDYSLKKFNGQGQLLARVGKKGRRPGSFMTPGQIRLFKGSLYISQRTVPGIQVFDAEDLTYQTRIPYLYPIATFAVLAKNEILLASLRPNGPPALTSIDSLGRVRYARNIGTIAKSSSPIMDSFDFSLAPHRDVIVVFEWRDLILRQDWSGNVRWQTALIDGQIAETRSIAGLRLPSKIVHKSVAVDARERIYVLAGHYAENPGRDIWVLDPRGQKIDRLILPESSHLIHIDRHDHLYARSKRGSGLVKYEIEDRDSGQLSRKR